MVRGPGREDKWGPGNRKESEAIWARIKDHGACRIAWLLSRSDRHAQFSSMHMMPEGDGGAVQGMSGEVAR